MPTGRRNTIEDARGLAAAQGGACKSFSGVGKAQRGLWVCARGHEWEASYASVRGGTWCKQCWAFSSAGENITRRVMELIFKAPFPTKRPKWLSGITGNTWRHSLELDGFNDKISIAFEYQGEQHYGGHLSGWRMFHDDEVEKVIYRDSAKRQACWQRGVSLVVVPPFKNIHDLQGCINQVEFSILAAGMSVPKWKRPLVLDELRAPIKSVFGAEEVHLMQSLAASKGGTLVSDSILYARSTSRLEWECHKGHRWLASWSRIRAGQWCWICHCNSTRADIAEAHLLADSYGGQCLSSDRPWSHSKLEWRCKEGHVWSADYNHVKKGYWCKVCADFARRIGLDKARSIAAKKGGRCLSSEYHSNSISLEWECSAGHVWKAGIANVVRGGWCRKCFDEKRRLGLEAAREFAHTLGAECLSSNYKNSCTDRLMWRCAEGHEFQSTFGNVRAGHWCPECYNKRRRLRPAA